MNTRSDSASILHAPSGQRGAVLITSLVLLLIMTVLGVSTMRGANLEERMALNSSLAARAFNAAESALREAYTKDSELAALVDTAHGTSSGTSSVNLGPDELNSSYEIVYMGGMPGGPGAGSSISLGRDHFFELRAAGEVEAESKILSRSRTASGVVYFMPDI